MKRTLYLQPLPTPVEARQLVDRRAIESGGGKGRGGKNKSAMGVTMRDHDSGRPIVRNIGDEDSDGKLGEHLRLWY